MKKILFLNTVYSGGGASSVTRSLFERSLKEGYNSFFAFGLGNNKGDRLLNFGNKIEFWLHAFLVRFLGLEGYGSFFSTRKLIKFIKKNKFDLIHIHNLHGYYVNFFKLLSFLNKENIPIVWTLHDEWPITWLPAHSMGCEHCKTLEGVCTNSYSYPKNYFPIFRKYTFNKKVSVLSSISNMTIVSPARWLFDSLRRSFLKDKNIVIIENGVDVDLGKKLPNKEILKSELGIDSNKKAVSFFCVNSNDKNKGIDYVFELVDLYQNKHDVLFMGMGEKIKGNYKNILFFDKTKDKEKIYEFLGASDVFVFPSLAETQPLSVLEALACEVPVVSFEIPATKDLEEYVYLTPSKDTKLLALKLDEVLNNDCKKISHERFIDRFSINIFFDEYINLYKKYCHESFNHNRFSK